MTAGSVKAIDNCWLESGSGGENEDFNWVFSQWGDQKALKKVISNRVKARLSANPREESRVLSIRIKEILFEKLEEKVKETGAKSAGALVCALLEEFL